MSFDTPNGPVFEPENPMLRSLYEALKKHAPTFAGCSAYDDFLKAYEALEYDTRDKGEDVIGIKAV